MKRDGKFMKVMGVFLGLVLLLTFFSKTIYNFNLPTVTVVMPAGGILVDKVEKTALITYSDINNIYAETDRRVKEVLAAAGHEVKKGQALIEFYTDAEKIDDLTLQIQKKEQDIELLTMKLSALKSDRQFDLKLNQLENQMSNETRKLQRLEKEVGSMESEIEAILDGSYHSPKMSEYEQNIKIVEDDLHSSEILLKAGGISQSELNEAKNDLGVLKLQYEQYIQSEMDDKTEQLKAKRELIDDSRDALFSLGQEQESVNQEKESSVKNMDYEISDTRFQINNTKTELTILKKQLAQAQSAAIISDYDGVVVQVNVGKNQFINKNDILMQLAGSSEVFELEVTIDEDELELIPPESKIEVKVKGIQKSFAGEIISSAIEQNDGETKRCLTIEVKNGDYQLAHRNATVTFTAESEKYEAIVPNSAIRKDDKGYYVLMLKEEDNIFGKNYLAQRVYVDIIDSDNSLSAISGLTYLEPVIETSTAPIDHGSRVKYEKQ